MEELNIITNEELDELFGDEDSQYTKTELMTLDSMQKIPNPFLMLTVKDVMKDLNICETSVYRLFKRDDFPSINIGKNNQVMLLPYLMWKMEKRD